MPYRRAASKRRGSSMTEVSFHGIHTSPPERQGGKCYPCLRCELSPVSQALRCTSQSAITRYELVGSSQAPQISPLRNSLRRVPLWDYGGSCRLEKPSNEGAPTRASARDRRLPRP